MSGETCEVKAGPFSASKANLAWRAWRILRPSPTCNSACHLSWTEPQGTEPQGLKPHFMAAAYGTIEQAAEKLERQFLRG